MKNLNLKTVKVSNIEYDFSDEKPDGELPTSLTIAIPNHAKTRSDIIEYVSDYISHNYGFCVSSLSID